MRAATKSLNTWDLSGARLVIDDIFRIFCFLVSMCRQKLCTFVTRRSVMVFVIDNVHFSLNDGSELTQPSQHELCYVLPGCQKG